MTEQPSPKAGAPKWRSLKISAIFLVAFCLQGTSLLVFRADDVRPPIVVTNTLDDPENPPEGSLRHAIRLANATPGFDVILFDIAIVNGTNISIPLQAQLDPITEPLFLNGGVITNAPTATIDGRDVVGDMMVITQTHGTIIQGLRFVNVRQGSAISVITSPNTLIQGNVLERSLQGIKIHGGSHITAFANTISEVEEFGIGASGTHGILLARNEIVGVRNGSGLELGDGLQIAHVITNAFSDIGGAAIHAGGRPSPLEVLLGWITTREAREQIVYEPGVNNDFPAPTILSARLISPTLHLDVKSLADPAEFTYPLNIAFYSVQDGNYSPLGVSALLDESAFQTARAISIPFSRALGGLDQISAIATTANPSSSVFADPVTLQLGLSVEIDVKPGDEIACINLSSKGVTAVVIFGSETFDVSDVDGESLRLAGSPAVARGKNQRIGAIDDVNGDGIPDLVVHFSTGDLELALDDVEVTLTGALTDGTSITGLDAICLVPRAAAKGAHAEAEPTSFSLSQNYPNPFNPQTLIDFQIPESRHVELRIFNLLGQEVRTLVNAELAAGTHSVEWDATGNTGRPVATGIYLYVLRAGDFEEVRKMHLVR